MRGQAGITHRHVKPHRLRQLARTVNDFGRKARCRFAKFVARIDVAPDAISGNQFRRFGGPAPKQFVDVVARS